MEDSFMAEKLLTITQVCEIFQVSRSTVDRWKKEGLKFLKIGRNIRFEENTVNEWKKFKANEHNEK